MSFSGHLRTLRQEAGLSRAGLARRAGVPVTTLRNWENGRGFPALPAFVRLAKALGVPPERLAEGVDDPAEQGAEFARGETSSTRATRDRPAVVGPPLPGVNERPRRASDVA